MPTARPAACYPVQTYLHAKQDGIAGCPAGTFYYHPIEHRLVPLTLGAELDAAIHEPFTNQPIFEQARFSLFFVNQPRAIEPIYGELAGRFSLLEAGAMAQVLETSAWRFNLGVCPIGWLDFPACASCFTSRRGRSCCTPMSAGSSKRRTVRRLGGRCRMTALELLTRPARPRRDVVGGRRRSAVQRPKGTLGSGATELLARHKAELVRLLKSPDAGAMRPRPQFAGPSAFPWTTRSIALSSVTDWCAEDQDPYVRYVAPYQGFLYQRLALDKTFVRGEGCYLFDKDGTGYADFVAQFGAVPFGHDPEPIWQALEAAGGRSRPNLVITSISAAAGELAEQLLAVAPAGLAHVVFTNSGAEAVEAAIKLARSRTGRTGILSTRNGFHGLTLAAMSATGREFFQRGFGAPVPGFDYVPFADLAALKRRCRLRPDFFAAFMVEVIQGESGIHVAPPGYLARRRTCASASACCSSSTRCRPASAGPGTLFACEAEGVTPDILMLAKALGGGLMSIGACLYSDAVFTERFDLRHGSTFAGNTLACRAALATLHELTKDDQRLVRQVATLGRRPAGAIAAAPKRVSVAGRGHPRARPDARRGT